MENGNTNFLPRKTVSMQDPLLESGRYVSSDNNKPYFVHNSNIGPTMRPVERGEVPVTRQNLNVLPKKYYK